MYYVREVIKKYKKDCFFIFCAKNLENMEDKDLQRECSFCNNEWSINEGFNLETNQCKGCDDYDREEPLRKLEREWQRIWWQDEGQHIERYLAQNHIRKY